MNICTVCNGRGFTEDGGSPIGRAFLMGYSKGKEADALLATMKRIAFEPFGHPEATAAEVLEAITAAAREAVAKAARGDA